MAAALKTAEVLADAAMTLSDGGGKFVLYDFYGNPLPAKGGKIVVPLDGLGYFLRTDGSHGLLRPARRGDPRLRGSRATSRWTSWPHDLRAGSSRSRPCG